MTREIDPRILLLEPEPPQQCDYCGKVAELRPYGRNGAAICFECGMADRKTTEKMFSQRLDDLEAN
jgi:hypothetical protein